MAAKHFLAFDFGAESGRGIVITLEAGRVEMEEVHRWPNRPAILAGTRHWDFPYLYTEMLETMKLVAQRGVAIDAIGVDTWGVDYGLLDGRGKLLGLPVQYRDARTEGIHDYSEPTLSRQRIFELTGYEPWSIASLFQLLAQQRDADPTLPAAETFLNTPDLFNYFLTGRAVSEKSIANTSNLMGIDGRWSDEVVIAFGLKRSMLKDLVEPGTVLGPLSEDVQRLTGLGAVPVVAVCGHDTSGALAAAPAEGADWAFLSCGTWSIIGTLVDEPINTAECLAAGFTNEYTLGGWYMARNISGLWLVQELRRKWNTAADPWDYPRMTAEAATDKAVAYEGLIDVADASLAAPADMEEALQAVLAKHNQPAPATRGQLIHAVLVSLALEYRIRMDAIAKLTGRPCSTLYMVGGGIANRLLCQFTADACGFAIHAGADQCTAMGNALTAALAVGAVDSADAIRTVVRDSVEMTTYEPTHPDQWATRLERYRQIAGRC